MRKLALLFSILLSAQTAYTAIYDWEAPVQADHHVALRCYLPDSLKEVRAIIILSPGLNADGRNMANDPEWQSFALRNGCALVAYSMTGGDHGIYYEAEHWSGSLLLLGMVELAGKSSHPELNSVPFGLWGHSAGGQFNYNFACYQPERTFAFVTNKGGYYAAPATPPIRRIPSLWIAGAKDTDLRVKNITSLYAENRRKGAPWGLIIEPGIDHAVGRSREIGMAFLEDALALSFDSTGKFKGIDTGTGWLADFQTKEISRNTTTDFGPGAMTWLPGEATANIWKSIMLGLPSSVQNLRMPSCVSVIAGQENFPKNRNLTSIP